MSRFPQFIVYCTCRGTWSFKQIWIPFIQGCFVQSLIGPVLIHDPDRLLTFDLMVKFIGFLTCFHVWSIIFFWFDIGLPYVWHMGVSPWEDVSQTFNIDLWPQGQIYRFLLCLCVQPSWNFCLLWHWHTLFAHAWVYHHERMCRIYSWSWYDVDLWPQCQIYRIYDQSNWN